MDVLKTVDEVIDSLGGTVAVASITSRVPSAVSNWRTREKFAPETYLIMTSKLATIGKTAPPTLWGMDNAPQQDTAE